MCGRFVSFSSVPHLAEAFEVTDVRVESLGERYNVAPSQDVYAILGDAESRRLGSLRWGFVPWFAKDHKRAPINARSETVATNGMFKESFATRRCLLPADGFWEWQTLETMTAKGKPAKQPWHLADPDGAPLAFAGIFSSWRDPSQPDGPKLHTAAIVTAAAQGPMTKIHDRMPVILPPPLYSAWLDPTTDVDTLGRIIQQVGPPRLRATKVTDAVNNVRNDGPELLQPA
jgi:putative SOS response-associated peptidase YedK